MFGHVIHLGCGLMERVEGNPDPVRVKPFSLPFHKETRLY